MPSLFTGDHSDPAMQCGIDSAETTVVEECHSQSQLSFDPVKTQTLLALSQHPAHLHRTLC